MDARDVLLHQEQKVVEVVRRLLRRPMTTTASITLKAIDNIVLVDATGGAITITLPPVAQHSSRVYTVKKIDASGNAVTVDGNGAETIDGALTAVLAAQWDSVMIVSNGTAWFKI